MGLVCPGIETLAIPIYISTSKVGDSLFPWQQWSSLIRKVKMVSRCSFTLHLSYKWDWHLFMFQSHLISFTVTGQYLFLHFSYEFIGTLDMLLKGAFSWWWVANIFPICHWSLDFAYCEFCHVKKYIFLVRFTSLL